jgi:hypothetical protein
MNILISTIIRNRDRYLNDWNSQLKSIIQNNKQHKFFLSVYENDSVDNTVEVLRSLNFSHFEDVKIKNEKLNTEYYGSIKDDNRVKILAECRNKTLFDNNFIEECDYVISVEPDIIYNPEDLNVIINDTNYDILSPRSVQPFAFSDTHIYDKWGTRISEDVDTWTEEMVFQDGVLDVWSTYNCFCKYKADLIKKKIAFSGFNKRFNKYDCDTAVICENFRENGYNKIGLLGKIIVQHI